MPVTKGGQPPSIIVLAGPNGAGKTTAAAVLLPQTLGVSQFVNADLIAKGLSPFAPYSADLRAAEIMLRRIHELLHLYQVLVDSWTLCDNSGEELLVVAQGTAAGTSTVFDAERLASIRRAAGK